MAVRRELCLGRAQLDHQPEEKYRYGGSKYTFLKDYYARGFLGRHSKKTSISPFFGVGP